LAHAQHYGRSGAGRRNGKDHFQTEIRELLKTLAQKRKGKTVLERLFQPQPEMRPLFRVFMEGLDVKRCLA
jgi:hypothetical protein